MPSTQKFQFRLNKAPVGGGFASSKLPDGSYRVKLYKIFVKESENKKRNATDFVVVEFDVVQVLNGGTSRKDFKGNDMTASPGDRRSWALDMSYANSPGNLNEFLAAAAGVNPQDPEALREAGIDFDAAFEEALDEDNPLADTELIVDVVTKKTDGGRDYLAHRWSAVA